MSVKIKKLETADFVEWLEKFGIDIIVNEKLDEKGNRIFKAHPLLSGGAISNTEGSWVVSDKNVDQALTLLALKMSDKQICIKRNMKVGEKEVIHTPVFKYNCGGD